MRGDTAEVSPLRPSQPPLHRGRRKSSLRPRTGTSTSSSRSPGFWDHDRKAELRGRHCLFRSGAFLAAREVSVFRSCAPDNGVEARRFPTQTCEVRRRPCGKCISAARKLLASESEISCPFPHSNENPAKAGATGGVRGPLGRTAEPQGTLIMPFVVLRSWLRQKKGMSGIRFAVAFPAVSKNSDSKKEPGPLHSLHVD
jgi:hypothetical protein